MLGCKDSNQVIVEPNPLADPFLVSASNYATNFYFMDTSYISSYEPYFLNDPSIVNWKQQIVQSEVWISRLGAVPDPNELFARADLDLPAHSGKYPDSLRDGYDEPGRIETFPAIRLDARQYELVGDGYLGMIRIDFAIRDVHRIAVAYRRADGTQYGEFAGNVVDSTFLASHTLILLKLVKPANLFQTGPIYRGGWKLLVKSIYPIGYSGVIKTLFQLDVFQQIGGTLGMNSVQGQPLLAILGLDRLSSDDTPTPRGDGLFDYRLGRTIDQNHGYIFLPYLRPFDDGIRRYFASIGQPLNANSTVLMPQIYDTATTAQSTSFTYVIKGRALHQ
jgi:hypothetical protein